VQAGAQDYLTKGEVDSASLRRAERCGAAGDEVLVEVARRLREQLRGVDTVARLGGDEFVVLCEGVADEQAALALADRLCRALEDPCAVTGGPAEVSAAIGVAVARRPGGRRVAPAPRRRGDVRRKARRRRARRARRRSLSGRMVETAKGPVEVVELTRAQQAAVRRAAEARATVPAFSVGLDAAVPAVPALVAAAARALRAHPAVNGAYRDGRLERYGRVNVAVVVPGPEVPLSPVVFDADTKPVATIEAEVAALAARAAAGELTAPEQAGATFTVLHVPAVTRVEPVLPPGAAAALGAGAGALTLACDARALTAVAAAAFLAALVEAAA
jgi:pyruvate/2-oxoglutarate dehydrogenase complex dihydrolipoamide acyltransferase (E2) component